MPEPTPEGWALIRHAYEHTDKPLAHICAEHDVSIPTLRYRMKVWQWRRRKPLIPREGPPPALPLVIPERGFQAASPEFISPLQDHPSPTVFAAAQTVDSPAPGKDEAAADPAAIVARLKSAVTRLLPAIESVIAQLASGPHAPRVMEQAARALGNLTRTLRELNTLLAQHEAGGHQGQCPDCAALPQDIDAIRLELARRIDAFIVSRMNDGNPDAPDVQAKPAETW